MSINSTDAEKLNPRSGEPSRTDVGFAEVERDLATSSLSSERPCPHSSVDANLAKISIVMSCLNEILTIRDCVEEAITAMKNAGICGEVVIADNGSTDGSQELAALLGARVVDVSERGYGSAPGRLRHAG